MIISKAWQRVREFGRKRSLEDQLRYLRQLYDRYGADPRLARIAAARAKISAKEAKQLILQRLERLLTDEFDGYLRQYQRAFIAAVENLWDKYAVTTKQILAERDREAAQLNRFLVELGYE